MTDRGFPTVDSGNGSSNLTGTRPGRGVTDKAVMRRRPFITMRLQFTARAWLRSAGLLFLLALAPAAFASPPAASGNSAVTAGADAGDKNTIVSQNAMDVETDNGGAFGQLVVDPAILSSNMRDDLTYTITSEPAHGRVGLSGGGSDAAFFQNRTSQFGYYAYRAQDGFTGADSFAYSVRNRTTGLTFLNTVVITVKPPPPLVMKKIEVSATPVHLMNVHAVSLTTRPNIPVTRKVPNHEDFMAPADRRGIVNPKIAYVLDGKAKPQHGAAQLNRTTGLLTYAPNPGFIGEDHFKYYTVDENNPQLGMENVVNVSVEPIRAFKHVTVDRSHSREVDLLFVINNSPSMARHQARLAASLGRFRKLFNAYDLDYRIGVLTTDFVNADPDLPPDEQHFYKEVRAEELDRNGHPILNLWGHPKHFLKHVASNGNLVTLPEMPQPWVTRQTPDSIFAELVKVGTNGDSNRTAFTSVYNFVAGYYHGENKFLRPHATTVIVFFMDEEETRMATWVPQRHGPPRARWIENGKLPDLIKQYDARHPNAHLTLDSYINYWVLRPFIIAKGDKRGKLEIDAVVAPNNISHRRAAELTGGSVLNIDSDFSQPLAALGDRIARTVSVALDPVPAGATLYTPSLRVLVDGHPVAHDPKNGWVYDSLTNSVRFHGAARKQAFTAKIDITYEEHM